jgi:AraC-like DNA-binding protein
MRIGRPERHCLLRLSCQGAVRRDERMVAAVSFLLGPDHARAEELAEAAELSPARFTHLFVQTTGMLPGELLRLLKRYRSELDYAVTFLERLDPR